MAALFFETMPAPHTHTRHGASWGTVNDEGVPSGRLSGDEERFEHLSHFRQLIMGLKAARVG